MKRVYSLCRRLSVERNRKKRNVVQSDTDCGDKDKQEMPRPEVIMNTLKCNAHKFTEAKRQ